MALKFLAAKDLFTLHTALVGRKTATAIECDTDNGESRTQVYYKRTDKAFVVGIQAGDTPTTQGIRYEPLFLDSSASGIDSGGATGGFGGHLHYAVGQFNPTTSLQRFYTGASAVGNNWDEVDPDDFSNVTADVYPLIHTDNSQNGILLGNAGHWSTGRGSLFFEGLTDGIAGVTVLSGTNVYPKGLMMIQSNAATIVTSGDANNAIIWVDVDTGDSTGIVALPGGTASSPTINKEPLIAGDTFDWENFQYIPDDDATFAKPKGRLMISSRKPFNSSGAGIEKIYVRFVEFNPLALAGTPTRTDLEVILTTRVEFQESPLFDVPSGPDASAPQHQGAAWFHTPTNRIMLIQGLGTGSATTTVNEWYVGSFSLVPEIDTISPIVMPRIPRTNDVARFETHIEGSLGEKIAGVTATWAIENISTFGEILTFSPDQEPAATATVSAIPIDANDDGDPEGTLVLKGDGTPLVETTDYTVVLVTGVITLVTSQTGKVMTADWQHTTNPEPNPHGTLLGSTTTSDSEGRAITRVSYADNANLVGELDNITASVDDAQ